MADGLETAGGPSRSGRERPRRRLSREELAGKVRERIFRAAAQVVGRHGYASASIQKITERAGMAQGTFYLYFASRQALFDELLPHVGRDMMTFISARLSGARDVFDMEERGFRAFFDFLETNPGFFRILNEAEVAAPRAYETHFRALADRYVSALQRSVRSGEIERYADRELEAIAYMLSAARSYLYMRYVKGGRGQRRLPAWVVATYVKMLRGGLG